MKERTQMTGSITPFMDPAFPAQLSMGLWIAFRAPFLKPATSCLLGCRSVGDSPRQMALFGIWLLATVGQAATISPALGP